ncbi:MAG: hypothetical protein DRN90_02405 [Thermoproteota archaeon]|nr:MAG: hypothetical protein DRN90_02405 [Candidatus Korarchaeota archaeon]
MQVKVLLSAARELAALAYMGYPEKPSFSLISAKYSLSERDLFALKKIVRWPKEAISSSIKRIPPEMAQGKEIRVDGYNVLGTIQALIEGEPIFLSNDGFVRDITSAYRSFHQRKIDDRAIELLLGVLEAIKPKEVLVLFDQPVSKSGELSSRVRKGLSLTNLKGDARTEKAVDTEVSKGEIAASSDISVIKRAIAVIDLPSLIGESLEIKPLKFWKDYEF